MKSPETLSPNKRAYTVREISEQTGIPAYTIYSQIREGTFPARVARIGDRIIINREDIDRLIDGESPRSAVDRFLAGEEPNDPEKRQ